MKYGLLFIICLVSFSTSAQDTTRVREEIFEFAQELPKPKIDLQKHFVENVKYPDLALETGTQGTVYVKAIVTKTGDIESVSIGKGLKNGGAGLNDEAMRVVKLIPKGSFIPAKNNGQPVNCWITIPVKFRLDGGEEKEQKSTSYTSASPMVDLDAFFAGKVKAKKIPSGLTSRNGTVYIRAYISDNGMIDDRKLAVATSVSKKLDKEAIRLVKLLPDYKPATVDGKAIGDWVEIPVKFWKYKKQ